MFYRIRAENRTIYKQHFKDLEVEEVALPESLSKIILIFELIYFVWRFETTHLLHYEKIIYSFNHSNNRLTSVGTDHLQD